MNPRNLRIVGAALIAAAATAAVASAQLPFFPGAEGYGGTWSGTAPAGGWLSNATVYRVTNLNDGGPGSLRGAFAENTANKIIVFDVAGTINLTSDSLDIKNLANYYIAGQTAPGPVTIYGDMVQLTHSGGKENRNVVLRYLSFRKGTGDNSDSITFAGSGLGTNLILDHVSASWSEDEILSVANNNTNVTVQYSTIHDALVNNHAYGSLIRPRIDSQVTFHHNLYAHNASRQARFGTYNGKTLTADFRNNVVYNFRDRASYAGGSSEPEREFADVNYVGNYIIAGPGTVGNATRAFSVDQNMDARVYQSGNFIDSDKLANPGGVPNGANTGWGMFGFGGLGTPVQTLTQMATPFATPGVTTQTAPNAYQQVIDHVGNWWWNRDAIDTRVINNLKNFTGPTIGAAAPNAGELAALLAAPMISHPAGWDTDNDGMPDAWELKHGLSPDSSPAAPDWKLDFDNDGYINLIEYINERGEFPAPAPIAFNGSTNTRYALITNWRTDDGGVTAGSNWQPSMYDVAEIRSGTAIVDAVGQHAGVLRVAPTSGSQGILRVERGWIEVAEALELGAGGHGIVEHVQGSISTPQVVMHGGPGRTSQYGLVWSGELGSMATLNAGRVDVAPNPGDSAEFSANLGVMNVTQELEVGAGGDGFFAQRGAVVVAETVTVGPSGIYQISGGTLRTNSLYREVGGQFQLIGGLLIASDVNFDLAVTGGALGAGDPLGGGAIGVTNIHGNLNVVNVSDLSGSGVLALDLAGTGAGQYDQVVVDGYADLNGALSITLQSGYAPQVGSEFSILSAAGGVNGMPTQFDLPPLPVGMEWALARSATTLTLSIEQVTPYSADFNYDGMVDAADKDIWQTFAGYQGMSMRSLGDANLDGVVDGGDLLLWQQQLGLGASAGGAGAAVPEPTALTLIFAAAIAHGTIRRQSRA